MSKSSSHCEIINKDKVYNVVEEFINERITNRGRGILWFYSISTCFGFYSEGMRRFKTIIEKLDEVARYTGRSQTDLRLLLNIDSNDIDQFALRRMKVIFDDYEDIIKVLDVSESERQTEKNKLSVEPYIQYFISGNSGAERLLVTEIQTSIKDKVLGLQLNPLANAKLYSYQAARDIIERYKKHFELVWTHMKAPRSDDYPELNLERLEKRLGDFDYKGIDSESEKGYERYLEFYLKGAFGSHSIETQFSHGHLRFDIVLGSSTNEIILELKCGLDSAEENRLRGQIQQYKEEAPNIIILLIKPKINKRQQFKLTQDFKDDKAVRFVILP